MRIIVYDILHSHYAAYQNEGEFVYTEMAKAFDKKQPVELDFLHIKAVSFNFLNASMGKLFLNYPLFKVGAFFATCNTDGIDDFSDKSDAVIKKFLESKGVKIKTMDEKEKWQEFIPVWRTISALKDDELREISLQKKNAEQLIIKDAILNYLQNINDTGMLPKKLSVAVTGCHVEIWAEISENDEKTENALILAEAKVNSKFHPYGVDINSTIMEDCDNVPAPPDYFQVI